MPLSATQLQKRLAFDAAICRSLASPLLTLTGYTGMEEMRAGQVANEAQEKAGRVVYYTLRLAFPVLVGPGPTTSSVTCVVDLLAGGNYPWTEPAVTIISRPLPFSSHVHPKTGSFCVGPWWNRARGSALLGQLVVHFLHIMNMDEPEHDHEGWQPAANAYWRRTMQSKPLNPGLQYPTLDETITHGVKKPAEKASERAASPSSSGFRPIAAPSASANPVFKAVISPPGFFRPVPGGSR